MTAMDLRPLSLAELLDRAFTLYRRHLWLFVGIMAVPSAFGLVFSVLARGHQPSDGRRAGPVSGQPGAGLLIGATHGGMALVAMVAYFVVYAVALGAITLAVSEIYQGRQTTIREVYGQMRPRLGRLVLLMLGMGLRAVRRVRRRWGGAGRRLGSGGQGHHAPGRPDPGAARPAARRGARVLHDAALGRGRSRRSCSRSAGPTPPFAAASS
jgi:hypothetical protein